MVRFGASLQGCLRMRTGRSVCFRMRLAVSSAQSGGMMRPGTPKERFGQTRMCVPSVRNGLSYTPKAAKRSPSPRLVRVSSLWNPRAMA